MECKYYFDQLLQIANSKIVDGESLNKSWQISSKLYSKRYTDYIDKTVNGTEYVSHSLTQVFSDICLKADGQLCVDYYLKYMHLTEGSAEEERSFALERIFVRFPETLLKTVGDNKDILDQLAWGFLNNRKIINKINCRTVFFKTNPSLKEKYNTYKSQIDYIIKAAELELDNP